MDGKSFRIEFNVMKIEMNQFIILHDMVEADNIKLLTSEKFRQVLTIMSSLRFVTRSMIELNGKLMSDHFEYSNSNSVMSTSKIDIFVPNVRLAYHQLKILDDNIKQIINIIGFDNLSRINVMLKIFKVTDKDYNTVYEIIRQYVDELKPICFECYEITTYHFGVTSFSTTPITISPNSLALYRYEKIDKESLTDLFRCSNYKYHRLNEVLAKYIIYRFGGDVETILDACKKLDERGNDVCSLPNEIRRALELPTK